MTILRTTMRELVDHVRDLTGAALTDVRDEQIQDCLDRTRLHARTHELTPLPTIELGGQVHYYDFTAGYQFWEPDCFIQNSGNTVSNVPTGLAWQVVTPATSNLLDGRWHFTDYYTANLFITGYTYDVFGAAADVFDLLGVAWLKRFNFSADGQSFNRREVLENYRTQAQLYRQRARIIEAELTRADSGDLMRRAI